ncbi:Aldose 1-epimerase [Candidatus Sulfotelmatomonas gaucii]|uniref:Aldose 1-epimerase n=1 Tax=Candidatus Sulfuritelmatomonas gaucii TaxID=2043161 RepID=A0A2N9LV81_9BACT|nr:Aldose 1-epimerase [Candidatus Sulfotelmatomonas gaucii]
MVKQAAKLFAIMIGVAMAFTSLAQGEVKMAIWGKTADGVAVPIYTLTSGQIEVRVTAYGAHLVSIKTPDRTGNAADIILGFGSLQGYLTQPNSYLGAIVGRYGNRIALGKFTLDGKTYQIPVNNGPNALHGGPMGFDQYVWKSQEVPDGVEFTHVSPDGDMGFPGTLTAKVRYTLKGDTLRIDYSATTDKATVLNITNHSYFNLHGDGKGNILDQRIEINADRYTPVDAGLIPTGELASVAGTPMDFRKPEAIGARIDDSNEQLKRAGGYDFNFVLNGKPGTMRVAAIATDPASGRKLTVETTEPGVQFYSGNFLDGSLTGWNGVKYEKHGGFCLETQHFPDSPNHPDFPSTELKPGETMHSTTTFTFGVTK